MLQKDKISIFLLPAGILFCMYVNLLENNVGNVGIYM